MFKYLKKYKKECILGPLFKMLEACFELIVPLLTASMIDNGKDMNYVLKCGAIMIIMGILGFSSAITAQYFAAHAGTGVGQDIRNDLYHHIGMLSKAQTDSFGSSHLVTLLITDVNNVQAGVNLTIRLLLRSPFLVIGSVILTFVMDVKQGIVFLVSSILFAAVIFFVSRKMIPVFGRIQALTDKASGNTRQILDGSRVIRAFSRQKNESEESAAISEDIRNANFRSGMISSLLNPLTYVIVNLAFAAILISGSISVNIGNMTQGDIIASVNYMTRILAALTATANLIASMTKAFSSWKRIRRVMDTEAEDNEPYEEPSDNGIAIKLDHVCFSYDKGGDNELDDLSLTIRKGTVAAFIGPTGSGKSTASSIIRNLYKPDKGNVLVLGKIASVSQHPFVFSDTIRANLIMNNTDISDSDIVSAIKTAQAENFAADTTRTVSDKTLSGGQKQRLTIARALITKPDILILDDCTSSLDNITANKLRKEIIQKTETVVIISQRVEDVKNADIIFVFDNGKISDCGTHESLINSSENYRSICNSQDYSII